MRKVAALLSLLDEAINAGRRLTAEGFIALSRLIDGAAVVSIEYDDVNTAAEWIKVNLAQADQGRSRPVTADVSETVARRPA